MKDNTVRSKIRKAFAILRKKGYFARMNFMCCSTCALYEIKNDKFVFFHHQDNYAFNESGECTIRYGSTVTDANEIYTVLKSVGLTVDWDGDLNRTMCVS